MILARLLAWWQRRRWIRAEARFLAEAMKRDLIAAGFPESTAEQVARDRLAGKQKQLAFPPRWHALTAKILPDIAEPWLRPGLILLGVLLLLTVAPQADRARATLLGRLPWPESERLAVLTIYPRYFRDTREFGDALASARRAPSIEAVCPFRQFRLYMGSAPEPALEACPDFEKMLAPVPRRYAFPGIEYVFPWRDGPVTTVTILARLRPGATVEQAAAELRADPGIRWTRQDRLADVALPRPIFVTILWAGLVLLSLWRGIRAVLRDRRLWRYRLYGVFQMTVLAAFGMVSWISLMLAWQALFPVPDTWQAMAFATIVIAYLLGVAVVLVRRRQDLESRCRVCLRRLRLPLEEGDWGALLVRPENVQSLCPWGHGHLVVDRLAARWTFSGDFWEELLASSKPE